MRGYNCLIAAAMVLFSVSASADSATDLRNAKKLYERMTGKKVPSSKVEIQKVAQYLGNGQKLEAARYITTTPDFLNVQVKNFSLRLSNKDESVKVNFNDFSALIAGVVRDNKDFRDILKADYYYDVTGAANDDDARTRQFNQANFTPVETAFLDLTKVLTLRSRQQLVVSAYDNSYTQKQKTYPMVELADNPDTAGVLTSRTFGELNLSGGSNRRAVEFSLKQFLCVPMAEAADSNASDQYVGKDVERFPAGDYNKYLTSCKSCHSIMDGMRPAFAKMDFGNFVTGINTATVGLKNGDFYNSHGIAAQYQAYQKDVFNPTTKNLVDDLEMNQTDSEYYKTRKAYLLSLGQSDATATNTLMVVLNGIRDTKVLAAQIALYRAANAALLDNLRKNTKDATNRATYDGSCLDKLIAGTATVEAKDEAFLTCNLDRKKDMSLLYVYYDAYLTAQKTTDAEKVRLLGKYINLRRTTETNLTSQYLQAKEQSRFFPSNSFDSSTGVALKMNKGSYVYGFNVTSDSFVNNATLGNKSAFFGWRGANKAGGNGVKDFGRMLSDSRRFSQCMAKKVYESVCLKKLESNATLIRLGDRFEALNYNMKYLYADIALDSVCGIIKE